MGKQYSEEKFKQLTDGRKAQVLLQALNAALDNAQPSLKTIHQYLKWSSSQVNLQRISRIGQGLGNSPTRRQILDLLVSLERFLKHPGTEDEIEVRACDGPIRERKICPIYVILDHLRSAFNVGSIFRSAECLGIKHIYLVGYTPTPNDQAVQKTAMGTDQLVSWSQHEQLNEVLDSLKKEKIEIMALETSPQAQALQEFNCPSQVAILLGNERFGLSQDSILASDHLVCIPMAGIKNSLNVANTFSIVSYALTNQLNGRTDA